MLSTVTFDCCRPGAIYYVNQHTGDVQWEVPTEEAKPSSEVRASHILRKHKGKNFLNLNNCHIIV